MKQMTFRQATIAVVLLPLSIIFFPGCASDSNPIQFSPEHMATLKPRAEMAATSPVSSEKAKLSKDDEFKVEVAVYGYLLQQHPWDSGTYSAVFLQGSDEEVDALIQKYPHHVPPIKPSDRAGLRLNQAPLDKDTGRPAIILSVEIQEPAGDAVRATGKWYAGDAVTGSYNLNLRKTDGNWQIENPK